MTHELSPRQETDITHAVRYSLAKCRRTVLRRQIEEKGVPEIENECEVGELVDQIKRILRGVDQ